jgi:hypothetical protein
MNIPGLLALFRTNELGLIAYSAAKQGDFFLTNIDIYSKMKKTRFPEKEIVL